MGPPTSSTRAQLVRDMPEGVLRVAAHAGWACVAWMAVCGVDAARSGGPAGVPATLALTAELALGTLLRYGPWLLLAHAVVWLLRWRWPSRWWMVALIAVAACAPLALDQAAFLTSGAAISRHPQVMWIRAALTAGLAAVAASLCCLHLWSLQPEAAPRLRLAWPASVGVRARRIAARVLLIGVVLAPLVAIMVVMDGRLLAYVRLADALGLAAWMLAFTLGGIVGAPRSRPGAIVGSMLLLAVVALAQGPISTSRARASALQRSGLSEWTLRQLRDEPPRIPAVHDFAHVQDVDCARLTAAPPARSVPASHRNVLLLSVEALRADMLERRAKGRHLMPRLSEFARGARHFERAVTVSASTQWALGAVVTGRSVGMQLSLPTIPPTLFALTRERFDMQRIFLPKGNYFKRARVRAVLTQHVTPEYPTSRANELTDEVIDVLRGVRRRDERVLLWAHYKEPHQPHRTHDGFDFGAGRRARYYSEVAYFDHHLGRLLDFLRAEGFLEDSLVIIFSDHGESLGDPEYWGHGVLVNARVGDVPLIVHARDLPRGRTDESADLMDIAPTVTDYLGLPAPPQALGRSLLSGAPPRSFGVTDVPGFNADSMIDVLRRPPQTTPEALSRQKRRLASRRGRFDPKLSIADSRYRLILNRETGAIGLYDRVEDPRERRNLSTDRPATVERMLGQLRGFHQEEAARIHCQIEAERGQPPVVDFAQLRKAERAATKR